MGMLDRVYTKMNPSPSLRSLTRDSFNRTRLKIYPPYACSLNPKNSTDILVFVTSSSGAYDVQIKTEIPI